jgi:hypothetical protein
MWTLPFGHHEDRSPTNGYAATREAAMVSFAKSWQWEKWSQVSCRARSVSAQLNFVGANLRPDAERPLMVEHLAKVAAIHPSAARWKLNDRAVLFSRLVPPIREPRPSV